MQPAGARRQVHFDGLKGRGAVDADDAGGNGPAQRGGGGAVDKGRAHDGLVGRQQQQLRARRRAGGSESRVWHIGRWSSSGRRKGGGTAPCTPPENAERTGTTANGSCTDCRILMAWLSESSCSRGVCAEQASRGNWTPLVARTQPIQAGRPLNRQHAAPRALPACRRRRAPTVRPAAWGKWPRRASPASV